MAEWARPAAYALAALASAWVFWDARGREGFGAGAGWAWPLLTLLFPPAALPLYLAARLYTRRAAAAAAVAETEQEAEPAPGVDEGEAVEDVVSESPARRRRRPTLLYTAALVLAGAVYFYADSRGFEARLARAERAKLYQRPEEAMREYRAALRVREDGHTRKLLGLELLQAGQAEEALREFEAAGRAGEPAESLDVYAGAALDLLGRRAEAADRYRRFINGPACARADADAPCERAAARLGALESQAR